MDIITEIKRRLPRKWADVKGIKDYSLLNTKSLDSREKKIRVVGKK